jgi:serine/threonine-protein kinase
MGRMTSETRELADFDGLQRYQIVRLVAEGGMGSVYEARQLGAEGFAKTVAVKTIRPHWAADTEFVRLFIGEAKLVADLVHENIVQVYQLGRDDHRYYIVMEYVRGVTVERYIRHHVDHGVPLPVELGAFIASRVCRGLEYAHARRDGTGRELGIVHRDISPKNVLLNFEGVVKVTDFGIAKARQVMEQDEQLLMGRLEYMSPEQAQRSGTDRRSDCYSVGVLTYELLTGTLPTRGAGSLERLHQLGMSYSRPIQDVRPDLPDDLCEIIDRALQPDPADRFQSAGEMGYALEYHLYHDGYGPTNVTLGDYIKGRFPELAAGVPEPLDARRAGPGARVEQRAETMFGDTLDGPIGQPPAGRDDRDDP